MLPIASRIQRMQVEKAWTQDTCSCGKERLRHNVFQMHYFCGQCCNRTLKISNMSEISEESDSKIDDWKKIKVDDSRFSYNLLVTGDAREFYKTDRCKFVYLFMLRCDENCAVKDEYKIDTAAWMTDYLEYHKNEHTFTAWYDANVTARSLNFKKRLLSANHCKIVSVYFRNTRVAKSKNQRLQSTRRVVGAIKSVLTRQHTANKETAFLQASNIGSKYVKYTV